MVYLNNMEEHKYDGELEAGDKITIYINDQPTPVEFTVSIGYKGQVLFRYVESKIN